jgi:two-component system NarL family response regulator
MFVLASGDDKTLDGWRGACSASGEVSLIEVRSFEAVPKCLVQLGVQLVLLDTRLPRIAAARAIDQLQEVRRNVPIVAVGAPASDDVELGLFLAGARGFCHLDTTPEQLQQVIEVVLRGELWIRRALVPKLIDSLTPDTDDTNGATGRFAILTKREIEIARLIGLGSSNKRIALQLAISERTVKSHLTEIFRKTGTEDRVKLALLVSRRH